MTAARLFFIHFLIILFMTRTLCRAASTEENRRIAEENYPDSPLERFVATHLGDEFPRMRDDLIRRKKDGEGFVERHWNAWSELRNWNWHSDLHVWDDNE